MSALRSTVGAVWVERETEEWTSAYTLNASFAFGIHVFEIFTSRSERVPLSDIRNLHTYMHTPFLPYQHCVAALSVFAFTTAKQGFI